MKKKYLGLATLALLAAISLSACSWTKPTSKNDAKESSARATSEASSSSQDKEKEHEAFKPVFERLAQYKAYGQKQDLHSFDDLRSSQNDQEWLVASTIFEGGKLPQHAYYDVNKDGIDELLLGDSEYLLAVYYLHDQQPEIIYGAGVASAGGQRKSVSIYQDGTIVGLEFYSYKPDGIASFYKIEDKSKQVQKLEEREFTVAGAADSDELGLKDKPSVDLKQLNWQPLPVTETSPSSSVSEKTSKKMDLQAIAAGDFSSVAGTWRKADGQTLVFDANGLVDDQSYVRVHSIRDGVLDAGLVPKNPAPGGGALVFIPAGVPASTIGSVQPADESDQTRDRIWGGQQAMFEDEHFYYRVD